MSELEQVYRGSYGIKPESVERYCNYFSAIDGSWYMELADEEQGEQKDAKTYGPFASRQEAEDYLDASFPKPVSYYVDEQGVRPAPTEPIK